MNVDSLQSMIYEDQKKIDDMKYQLRLEGQYSNPELLGTKLKNLRQKIEDRGIDGIKDQRNVYLDIYSNTEQSQYYNNNNSNLYQNNG